MNKSNTGYTLIELLIYTVIFAISVGVFSGVLITFTRVQTQTSADSELTQQLSFVQSTIQRLVRDSANIQNPAGVASSSLVLRMASSSLDPTVISSDANGIYLQQGTGEVIPITNSQVKVAQFEAIKYENPNAHAIVQVNIALTYNSQNPYQQITRALKIAIGRVSAATFDDSLIPNTNNSFSLGDATYKWKDINISNLLNVGQLITDPVAGAQNGSIYYNTSSSAFRGYANSVWSVLGGVGWAASSTNIYNTNAGNVGIGTASPGDTLDVNGSIVTTGIQDTGKTTKMWLSGAIAAKTLDYMEYSSDANAQVAYVSNATIANPISHWKMNDNAATTVVVDSMSANAGTADANTDTLDTTGKINGALLCSVSPVRAVAIGSTGFPAVNTARSVSHWVYLTSRNAIGGTFSFGYGTGDTNKGWAIDAGGTSSTTPLRVAGYSNDWSTNYTLPLNEWHLITVTYDGTNLLKLYVDGTLQDSTTSYTFATVLSTAYIGGNWDGSAAYRFNGSIDDVRIYNFVLTATEVLGLYNNNAGTELQNPQGNLQSYSEATIKTQGSYALKAVAAITTSLNKTLTRTVSPTIDLSNQTQIKFDIRASRPGSNIKIGIHDSGGTTTETTPNIASADTYQTITWDISTVTNANKDAIDQIIVTIINADAANTFYIDNLYSPSVGSLADIIFTTASSERMRIDSSGNVGIGTTVPGAKLQISNADQTYALTLEDARTGNGHWVRFTEGGTEKWVLGQVGSGVAGRADNFEIVSGNGTTRLAIASTTGNVGIGTTGPGSLLHVKHPSGNLTTRFEGLSNSYSSKMYLSSVSSGDGGMMYDAASNLSNIFSYGDLRFNVGTANISGAIGNERMVIQQGGNVGIGTTGPGSRFTVYQNVSGATTAGMELRYDGTIHRKMYMNYSGDMYFYNGTNEGYLSSAGVWTNASDISLKSNIRPIEYGLADLLKLQPRSYEMNADGLPQIGFVAQEVEGIIPELVSIGGQGLKGLSYGNLTAINTKGIQELYQKVRGVDTAENGDVAITGNVGIGTADPGSYKLKVVGTVSVNSGTNIIYRCTTAGTLPIGALTINSGNCGASADTGLSVN
ncbi:MAG: LamG-like jellyroll fold domain-containing protein [bacterium]|nr:LamG-like jellyroll fold domain-containing protein [bacterium]